MISNSIKIKKIKISFLNQVKHFFRLVFCRYEIIKIKGTDVRVPRSFAKLLEDKLDSLEVMANMLDYSVHVTMNEYIYKANFKTKAEYGIHLRIVKGNEVYNNNGFVIEFDFTPYTKTLKSIYVNQIGVKAKHTDLQNYVVDEKDIELIDEVIKMLGES